MRYGPKSTLQIEDYLAPVKAGGSHYMPPSRRHALVIASGRKQTPFCHVNKVTNLHVTKGPRRICKNREKLS